jgi:hypothetical protein
MTSPERTTPRLTPQAVLGLVAVAVGLLLTADNLNVWETSRFVRYWPVGVVLVGLMQLLQSDSRSGRVVGGVVMFVGAVWTADWVFGANVDVDDFWPLILIALGVLVLTRARRPGEEAAPRAEGDRPTWTGGAPGLSTGGVTAAPLGSTPLATGDQVVSEVAIWAGKQRRNASSVFRRADLVAIMGGVELDLRQATTATGEAVIDVFVMWGGVEIWVPPDWAVSNQVSLLMGGAEDKSSGTQTARHRLIVRGVVVMGGLEIKT